MTAKYTLFFILLCTPLLGFGQNAESLEITKVKCGKQLKIKWEANSESSFSVWGYYLLLDTRKEKLIVDTPEIMNILLFNEDNELLLGSYIMHTSTKTFSKFDGSFEVASNEPVKINFKPGKCNIDPKSVAAVQLKYFNSDGTEVSSEVVRCKCRK